MYFYNDPTFLLVIAVFILALMAQAGVKSAFKRWSKVPSRRGLTAKEVARQILDRAGLSRVPVNRVSGRLSGLTTKP